MSKFKVGDNVRVLRNTSLEKRKDAYIGKEFTIKNLQGESMFSNGTRYGIGELYVVYENEIELATPRHEIHITCTDRRTTHAVKKVDGKIVARSKAVCCPTDEFDFAVGAQLAFNRLVHGTDYHPAEVALKPEQPKQEDKPKFKVGDKVRVIGTSKLVPEAFNKERFISEILEIKRINPNGTSTFPIPHYDAGKSLVFFEDELEPYTEPESTEPKQEPVKLYCVEDYEPGTFLTKGKVYEYVPGKGFPYDDYVGCPEKDYATWARINRTISARLVPLMSRAAKVGEYALVTNSDGTASNKYKNGDILRAIRRSGSEEPGFVYKEDCFTVWSIFDTEYLVLDGYKPEPEPEKAEPEYLNMKVVCVDRTYKSLIPLPDFTIGKVYSIVDGTITDDAGFRAGKYKTLATLCCGMGNTFIEFKGE